MAEKTTMAWAKEYAKQFMQMPDRYKELIIEFIYIFAMEDDADKIRVLMDIIGFPEECESPIEQILWVCLQVYPLVSDEDYYFETQTEVEVNGKNYRLDFLYSEDYDKEVEKPFRLAIECDGHDFHEKTKEQVEKRNKRDMDLKMAGYDVLHYSGSQIFKKPMGCVIDIFDYITKQLKEKGYETNKENR